MYINKLWLKNQIINLLFFSALVGLVYFLLLKNECSLISSANGAEKTCQCKGYEVIFKNTLPSKGEKKSACLGYINRRYDLSEANYYSTEALCGEATNQICSFKTCRLNPKDRTLPAECKYVGEGWVPMHLYLQ